VSELVVGFYPTVDIAADEQRDEPPPR
jgi:hypothetical protein